MKKQLSIILSVLLLLSVLLTGCARELTIGASGLQNMTLTGETTTDGTSDYTATLTPAEQYTLPATITVTIDGTALTEGYTYDATTGALTISASALTGNVEISGAAIESLVGTWSCTKDISDLVMSALAAADPTTADYFTFTDLPLEITMVLNADNTYSMEGVADELTDKLFEQMRSGLETMLEEALRDAELDMTLDEFLTASGISMDDLLDELAAEFDLTDSISALSVSGKYMVEGDKLYTSDDMDSEIDPEEYTTFTLVDGVLTFVSVTDSDVDADDLADILPLTFHRVG